MSYQGIHVYSFALPPESFVPSTTFGLDQNGKPTDPYACNLHDDTFLTIRFRDVPQPSEFRPKPFREMMRWPANSSDSRGS